MVISVAYIWQQISSRSNTNISLYGNFHRHYRPPGVEGCETPVPSEVSSTAQDLGREHTSDFLFSTLWHHTEACLRDCVLTEPHHRVAHVYGHSHTTAPCPWPSMPQFQHGLWRRSSCITSAFAAPPLSSWKTESTMDAPINFIEADSWTILNHNGFCNFIAVVIPVYVSYRWLVFNFNNKSIYIECSQGIVNK